VNPRRKTKTASSDDVRSGTPSDFEDCLVCRRDSLLADKHGHEHPYSSRPDRFRIGKEDSHRRQDRECPQQDKQADPAVEYCVFRDIRLLANPRVARLPPPVTLAGHSTPINESSRHFAALAHCGRPEQPILKSSLATAMEKLHMVSVR
jgi:hypothetical protein